MAEAMHGSCSLSFHRPNGLLREHRGVEAGGSKGARKRRRVQRDLATQNQASVRMEVDSEDCHGDISTDCEEKGYRGEATDSRAMGMAAPWYYKGGTSMKVIDPLLS